MPASLSMEKHELHPSEAPESTATRCLELRSTLQNFQWWFLRVFDHHWESSRSNLRRAEKVKKRRRGKNFLIPTDSRRCPMNCPRYPLDGAPRSSAMWRSSSPPRCSPQLAQHSALPLRVLLSGTEQPDECCCTRRAVHTPARLCLLCGQNKQLIDGTNQSWVVIYYYFQLKTARKLLRSSLKCILLLQQHVAAREQYWADAENLLPVICDGGSGGGGRPLFPTSMSSRLFPAS